MTQDQVKAPWCLEDEGSKTETVANAAVFALRANEGYGTEVPFRFT